METKWKVWTEDEISPKKIKTEDLFTNLNNAKGQIAKVFSEKYFNSDLDLHWIGEVLLIGDHYLQLDGIEFALKTEMEENVLFKYLSKPRKYKLEYYILGKKGRKEKIKIELKASKEKIKYIKKSLLESIYSKEENTNLNKEDDIN